MPKYAAFWLEERAEVALGLHSCSCWTEPAFNQQTDTSLAGTWGHSPRSFCQQHTIVIIQMIWEDLSGTNQMFVTPRLVCRDSREALIQAIWPQLAVNWRLKVQLQQLARANVWQQPITFSNMFRCGCSTHFQWWNSVTLVGIHVKYLQISQWVQVGHVNSPKLFLIHGNTIYNRQWLPLPATCKLKLSFSLFSIV